jgi:hypothetical protein
MSGIKHVETASSEDGVANKDGYKIKSNGEASCRSKHIPLEDIHHEIVSCFLPWARNELGFKADTTDHSTRLVDYPQFFMKEM